MSDSTAQVLERNPLSLATRTAIACMAAALDKSNPRAYGTCVGLRAGGACITDGFGLLEYRANEDLAGRDETLDRNLFPSEVKFPQWQSVIAASVKSEARPCDGEAVLALTETFRAPKRDRQIYMVIDATGRPSIQIDPCGASLFAVNPALIAKFRKGIPKGVELHSAELREDTMHLRFGGDGEWLLLVCAVQLAEVGK